MVMWQKHYLESFIPFQRATDGSGKLVITGAQLAAQPNLQPIITGWVNAFTYDSVNDWYVYDPTKLF